MDFLLQLNWIAVLHVGLKEWIQAYLPHHSVVMSGLGFALSIPCTLGALGVVALGRWHTARNAGAAPGNGVRVAP